MEEFSLSSCREINTPDAAEAKICVSKQIIEKILFESGNRLTVTFQWHLPFLANTLKCHWEQLEIFEIGIMNVLKSFLHQLLAMGTWT